VKAKAEDCTLGDPQRFGYVFEFFLGFVGENYGKCFSAGCECHRVLSGGYKVGTIVHTWLLGLFGIENLHMWTCSKKTTVCQDKLWNKHV